MTPPTINQLEDASNAVRGVADILLSFEHGADISTNAMLVLHRVLDDAAEKIFPIKTEGRA